MKRYNLKCRDDRLEYIDVLKEDDETFFIRITRVIDGYEKTTEDTLSRHMFDMCLKTGHIYELADDEAEVA